MRKITAFKNAQQFQDIFGVVEHGNGTKSRRNKILLEFYKAKSMWDYCNKDKSGYRFDLFFSIKNMMVLKERVLDVICNELYDKARYGTMAMYRVQLIDRSFWSHTYETDENEGIPSNGDVGFVRYVVHEENRNGKVYRMRAGRFYKRLLLESELGKALPQQVLNWLCEEFTASWSSYVVRKLPHFTLNIDDNFKRIYSYGYINDEEDDTRGCTEEFCSCMMGDGQWRFYNECVDAKAAYLTNDDGAVIARCVIFTKVIDEDGKVWRLAERQYAEYGRDLYKRCLVDALVEGGHIDGYKQVGVDCHSTTAYVDKDGNSLMDKEFHIECNLEFSKDRHEAWNAKSNHILSYQDSFKFFAYKERKAYNTAPEDMKHILMLDTTNSYLEGAYDDYHGYWCAQAYLVWVHGEEKRCDVDNSDDFILFEGDYIHKDDFVKCPVCGGMMPNKKYYRCFSFMIRFEETDTYVCSYDCYQVIKEQFNNERKGKFFYDDIFGKYVRKEDDKPVIILKLVCGEVKKIRCSFSRLAEALGSGYVKLVENTIVENECVPFYCAGLFNPMRRIQNYLETQRDVVVRVSQEIIEENKTNGINFVCIDNMEDVLHTMPF